MKNTELAALFKTIADSFITLSEIYSSTTEDAPKPKAKEKPAKTVTSTPTEETPAVADTIETVAKTFTKEEVRATLAQKAKLDGGKYKNDVKAMVAKYSSDGTLTKVPEDKYPELMADLEVVGNA